MAKLPSAYLITVLLWYKCTKTKKTYHSRITGDDLRIVADCGHEYAIYGDTVYVDIKCKGCLKTHRIQIK